MYRSHKDVILELIFFCSELRGRIGAEPVYEIVGFLAASTGSDTADILDYRKISWWRKEGN